MAYTMAIIWVAALSPRFAAASSTDRDRFWMAVIYLAVFMPAIGLVNKLVRSLKEGVPTCNSLLIALPAIVYVIFPRMLQAEAVKLNTKLIYSVLISICDLIMDISSPYSILLYLSAKRFVKARCKRQAPTAYCFTDIAVTATKAEAVSGSAMGKDNDATKTQHSKRKNSHPLRRQSSIMSAALSPPGPVGGLQSAFASLEVSPRYLRALSDQVNIWSTCELVALLFTNLAVLTAQAYAGASWEQLVEEGMGLVLQVAIEQLFELCVLCILMRWNNLPMPSSRSEKGVLRRIILTLFLFAGFWLITDSIVAGFSVTDGGIGRRRRASFIISLLGTSHTDRPTESPHRQTVMSMSDEGGAPPKRPRTQGGEEMTASDSKSSIAEGMAQLEERIASLHSHIQQATREAADVQELFNTTAAAQVNHTQTPTQ
ncbi:unnamed protein product [Vitrella brassicaformis CCMP3155]|uniref:Uncharacterized protein n=1 Tax=Vitrella brassicaformis (strain CCMP3155) TaxID=1169540 RepID=A0A0G4EAA6_VITBC|nr:unnamed protein product [Vitrella brassicaformis CCMP3155]|eukprot:CEL92177.1 unnamed protein product [Vitrella brassicaformis CCMP3155]